MNVHWPDGYGVAVRTVVRVVGAVGVEGIRDGETADLAVAGNLTVEVDGPAFAIVRAVEPAGAAAVGASVRH